MVADDSPVEIYRCHVSIDTINLEELASSSPESAQMFGLSRIALLATITAIGATAWKDQCEGFAASIPNVELKSTYYPSGALVNLTSPSNRLSRTSLPAFCRKSFPS